MTDFKISRTFQLHSLTFRLSELVIIKTQHSYRGFAIIYLSASWAYQTAELAEANKAKPPPKPNHHQ